MPENFDIYEGCTQVSPFEAEREAGSSRARASM